MTTRRCGLSVLLAIGLAGVLALPAAAAGPPSPDPAPVTTQPKPAASPPPVVHHTVVVTPAPVQTPPPVKAPVAPVTHKVVHHQAKKKVAKRKRPVVHKTQPAPQVTTAPVAPQPVTPQPVTTPDVAPVAATPHGKSTPIFLWIGAALAVLALLGGAALLVPNPLRMLRARKARRAGPLGPETASYARSYLKWLGGR